MTQKAPYQVKFILPSGDERAVDAMEGENLLEVAHRHGIFSLVGACEGSLACATCHVVVEPEWFVKLGNFIKICDEEEDMLDYAFGLTRTSRLGCQIKMCQELDGITVRIPTESRNI